MVADAIIVFFLILLAVVLPSVAAFVASSSSPFPVATIKKFSTTNLESTWWICVTIYAAERVSSPTTVSAAFLVVNKTVTAPAIENTASTTQ